MHTPQKRVEAYIRDWHYSWNACGGGAFMAHFPEKTIGKWQAEVNELTRKHWVCGTMDQSGSGFGYQKKMTRGSSNPSSVSMMMKVILYLPTIN